MSPYDSVIISNNLPKKPERISERYSDPFADPFEHDLLLNVRSETPDSIVVSAVPPSTPRSPRCNDHYSPLGGNSGLNSLVPPPTPLAPRFPGCNHHGPSAATLSPNVDRFLTPTSESPANTSLSPTRYMPLNTSKSSPALNSSIGNTAWSVVPTPPKRAASPPPVHKGWDDIKHDNVVPVTKPLNVGLQKKPLPQRRQPPLAGAGQILMSGGGLPITLKHSQIPSDASHATLKMDRGLGLEVPSPSLMFGSPGPTISEYSPDPTLQRQRSSEMLFADPHLVGRSF